MYFKRVITLWNLPWNSSSSVHSSFFHLKFNFVSIKPLRFLFPSLSLRSLFNISLSLVFLHLHRSFGHPSRFFSIFFCLAIYLPYRFSRCPFLIQRFYFFLPRRALLYPPPPPPVVLCPFSSLPLLFFRSSPLPARQLQQVHRPFMPPPRRRLLATLSSYLPTIPTFFLSPSPTIPRRSLILIALFIEFLLFSVSAVLLLLL